MQTKNKKFALITVFIIFIIFLTYNISNYMVDVKMKKSSGVINDIREVKEYFEKEESFSVGAKLDSIYDFMRYERDFDIKFSQVLLFQDLKNISYDKVTAFLDEGYDVIMNVEISEEGMRHNLRDILDGVYDEHFISLANKIKKDGRQIWLRPMHEFNGYGYEWCIYNTANSPDDFVPAWMHIVTIFRTLDAPVKFQLNYNRFNADDNTGKRINDSFEIYYAGDIWVDMVVVSTYNRCGTDKWHLEWKTFADEFDDAYRQITSFTNKSIGIAEMSCTDFCNGSKANWIKETFDVISTNYTQVKQVIWFLENIKRGEITGNWDLNTEKEMRAFREAYAKDRYTNQDFVKKLDAIGEKVLFLNDVCFDGK